MENVCPLKKSKLKKKIKKILPKSKFLLFPFYHFVANKQSLVLESKKADKEINDCFLEFPSKNRSSLLECDAKETLDNVYSYIIASKDTKIIGAISNYLNKYREHKISVYLLKKELISRILSEGKSLRIFTKDIRRGKLAKTVTSSHSSCAYKYGIIKYNKNAGTLSFLFNLSPQKIFQEFLNELNSSDLILSNLFYLLEKINTINLVDNLA